VDLKVTLVDGQAHDTDSNELAFRFAAADALNKAVQEAGAVLLEPIMKVEVVTPDDYFGNVMQDLNARRAEVTDTYDRGRLKVVEARAPLEKMFGYSTADPQHQPGARQLLHGARWNTPAAPDSMLEILGGVVTAARPVQISRINSATHPAPSRCRARPWWVTALTS
jgi:elongation factor G